MTLDIGTNLLTALLGACGTVLGWRALTASIVRAMNARPPDVIHLHHGEEEADEHERY